MIKVGGEPGGGDPAGTPVGAPTAVDLAPADLAAWLAAHGERDYRAAQVRRWVYGRGESDPAAMSDLPAGVRRLLAKELPVTPWRELRRQQAADGTEKGLLAAPDGQAVETVLMRYRYGYTACLSTQAGCRMGCAFCASTAGGLGRDLRPGEMMGEVVWAVGRAVTAGVRVSRVVLMGMGEPLDNLSGTRGFLSRLAGEPELGIGMRRVTVSTSGLVPGIDELASWGWPVTLAISLHAADDDLRSRLVPINRRWPLESVLAAARRFAAHTGRRVTVEYTLMNSVNDGLDQARQLARLLAGHSWHVNLIRWNPVPGQKFQPSPPSRVSEFAGELRAAGVPVTIRRSLGQTIDAACGQLRRQTSVGGAAQ